MCGCVCGCMRCVSVYFSCIISVLFGICMIMMTKKEKYNKKFESQKKECQKGDSGDKSEH